MHYLFEDTRGHRVNRQDARGVFPWTQADYAVLYINQIQREIPDRPRWISSGR